MFYYSKKSRRRVVHNADCACIQSVATEGIGAFETLEVAYKAGYRLCRSCSPIAKPYRKERDKLEAYCQNHSVSISFDDRFIGISTPISQWKILPDGNKMVLYHKNTINKDTAGPVPGYHLQWVRQETIMDYLEYIRDHDYYRNIHPVHIPHKKKNSPPPQKGTKRYRKERTKAAKKARRQSINNVLNLIDSLHIQDRTAYSE